MKTLESDHRTNSRLLLAGALLAFGCGDAPEGLGQLPEAASAPGPGPEAEDPPPEVQPSTPPRVSSTDPGPDLFKSDVGSQPTDDEPMNCGTVRAAPEVIRTPIDIIVILDNSGSMGDESDSVEQNINENFARILDENGVDYRMIVLSEHRERNGQNAICVARPLSGLDTCPAPAPVSSERFFHYSVEIGSSNSLGRLLDTYSGERDDEFELAPSGWSQWLRPGANKVFLEFTDDNANMSATEFMSELSALSPDTFGTLGAPRFVWHSIVGLAEKGEPTDAYLPSEPVETEECRGNGNNVFNAGRTYQELSQMTGGLRFPICQFQAYDTVFQTIASNLVSVGAVPCDFPLPAPPAGTEVELDKIALSYAPGSGGTALVMGQVPEAGNCQANAFFIDRGAVQLCPEACELVRADEKAQVEVLFTCESTVILR